MRWLLELLSYLPLWCLHGIGACAGWISFWSSATYRQRFVANAARASLTDRQRRQAVAHAGRSIAELAKVWSKRPVKVLLSGTAYADAAYAGDTGVIVLTPHLGCFEVVAQALAARYHQQGKELKVLYSPAKKLWLADVVATARRRPGLAPAPATLSGVKVLVKALRNGQALGILPDQVPPQGLGVWSPFFGHPAYTMTLPAKLALQTGASILLARSERLPRGRGYVVHFSALDQPLQQDVQLAVDQINHAMETLIRQCPQQYLWGYARYKPARPMHDVMRQRIGGA